MAQRRASALHGDGEGGFLLSVTLLPDKVSSFDEYPFSIPAVRTLGELRFDPRITFLIDENGSGKSTLVEAVAILAGSIPKGAARTSASRLDRVNRGCTRRCGLPGAHGARRRDSSCVRRLSSIWPRK